MHAILNREHGLVVAASKQPLKKASTEIGPVRVVRECRGRQLVLVSYENDSLWAELERNQG